MKLPVRWTRREWWFSDDVLTAALAGEQRSYAKTGRLSWACLDYQIELIRRHVDAIQRGDERPICGKCPHVGNLEGMARDAIKLQVWLCEQQNNDEWAAGVYPDEDEPNGGPVGLPDEGDTASV